MVSRSWQFTDLEFLVLCEDALGHGLPAPFAVTSRIWLYRDLVRKKQQAREAVRARLGGCYEEVLDAVAAPEIRILVQGWEPADGDNPRSRIRMLGASRGGRAYLLEQLPDETVPHSGGFTVLEFGVRELGAVVAMRLPEAPRGKHGSIDLSAHAYGDLDQEFGRSGVCASADDAAWLRAERFLQAPATCVGAIVVGQGISQFGRRRMLEWRDLCGDGRYLITVGGSPIAHGVDAKRLTARLDTEIADVAKAIKDERR